MSLLRCTRCQEEKPSNMFRAAWKSEQRSGTRALRKDNERDGKFSWCRPCCAQAAKEHVARKDPEQHKQDKRGTHYRTTYGITLGEYDRLNAYRDKGCWICGKPGVTRGLSVDHNHKTGQIRGLLCQSCNRGLRWFSDDPTRLRNAATYLETSDQLMVTALTYPDSSTVKETIQ